MRKPLLSILAALILISALSVLLVANLPSTFKPLRPRHRLPFSKPHLHRLPDGY
ncbi:hypothetical protein [Paenibacillus validus]|uniref:hypothetical protein n=1 Tax=Paenibacillus validus TaxID=44253 RepID=UPI003D2E245B